MRGVNVKVRVVLGWKGAITYAIEHKDIGSAPV